MPDWIVAVTAAVGAGFGVSQLILIRKANESASAAQQDYLIVERANLLKAIDDKFESAEMVQSRKAIMARLDAIESRHGDKPSDTRFVAVAAEFSAELTALYQAMRQTTVADEQAKLQTTYFELMRLPSYFETIGWMWSRKLVLEDDLLDLYDAVVIQSIGLLKPHIDWRRMQRLPHNVRYLKLAEQLYDAAIRYKRARETPPDHRPVALRDTAG